eukprot:1773103-Rhodomonas_salina.1
MVTAPDVGMRTPSAVARPNTHVWGASGWHAPLRELLEAAVEHRSTCVRPLTSTILRLSNNTDSATALNATLEASSELESSADGMAALRRRTQYACYPTLTFILPSVAALTWSHPKQEAVPIPRWVSSAVDVWRCKEFESDDFDVRSVS